MFLRKYSFSSRLEMLQNPAGERNKYPILKVLENYIDPSIETKLLEISSGPGLHASFLAQNFPKTTIQPSEYDSQLISSIKAYREHFKVTNVKQPIKIDISKELTEWTSISCSHSSFNYILNINMMHISPIECSKGLFANSAKLLTSGGLLFTYGPYKVNGVLTPQSNIQFDQNLRARNPLWGIRDILELEQFARSNAMQLFATHDLPSNNKCLVWKKD